MCAAKCAPTWKKPLASASSPAKRWKTSAGGQGVRGDCGGESLQAALLLSAVGRQPVTDGLQLENAGLKTGRARFY